MVAVRRARAESNRPRALPAGVAEYPAADALPRRESQSIVATFTPRHCGTGPGTGILPMNPVAVAMRSGGEPG